jgi:DnaJ family protein C protein 11
MFLSGRLAEKRREAQAAVELMRATFARVRSDEEAKRGLVIIKALYGRLVNVTDAGTSGTGEAGNSAEAENLDEVTDVTIPLQCLVKDSKLVLHEASKVCCVEMKESFASLLNLLNCPKQQMQRTLGEHFT